jgi:hypothetical protein
LRSSSIAFIDMETVIFGGSKKNGCPLTEKNFRALESHAS